MCDVQYIQAGWGCAHIKQQAAIFVIKDIMNTSNVHAYLLRAAHVA
jgi:hypothetical protein